MWAALENTEQPANIGYAETLSASVKADHYVFGHEREPVIWKLPV
jgi:hypothetical protein